MWKSPHDGVIVISRKTKQLKGVAKMENWGEEWELFSDWLFEDYGWK